MSSLSRTSVTSVSVIAVTSPAPSASLAMVAPISLARRPRGLRRPRGPRGPPLLAAAWNLDGDAWNQLLPRDAYLTGFDLWARHDLAEARTSQGDEQARMQVRRLLKAIKPAVFDDLADLSPQHPLDLVAEWMVVMMAGDNPQSVVKVACEDKVREDKPRVEVVDGSLYSAEDLRRAVVAGAITSGVVCALAGVGIGYLLGLRDGRE